LKNDLQSYMEYKNKANPKRQAQSMSDNQSVQSYAKSLVDSNRRTTKGIKQLFDSAYVKPEDNERVIQDTHPFKSAAIKEALTRYETNLKKESSETGNFIKELQRKATQDQQEFDKEKQIKVQKQRTFRDHIEN